MTTTTMTDLTKKTELVAADDAANQTARRDLDAARADLLASVVTVVRPALRALSSRVARTWTKTREGEASEPAPWRGIRLLGEGPLTVGNASRGAVRGRSLYLSSEGALVSCSYVGRWSKVEGEVSFWRLESSPVSALGAVEDGWDAELAMRALADALDHQLEGAKPERTRAMRERAERINAVAVLARASL